MVLKNLQNVRDLLLSPPESFRKFCKPGQNPGQPILGAYSPKMLPFDRFLSAPSARSEPHCGIHVVKTGGEDFHLHPTPLHDRVGKYINSYTQSKNAFIVLTTVSKSSVFAEGFPFLLHSVIAAEGHYLLELLNCEVMSTVFKGLFQRLRQRCSVEVEIVCKVIFVGMVDSYFETNMF